MFLLLLALAPVFIIALYIYYRDKYEKEPWKLLFMTLGIGALTTIPAILLGMILDLFKPANPMELKITYTAFITAALNEEFWKYPAFLLFIWGDPNFNERFDGIVYAVFISLGFAGIENILYVFEYSAGTGVMRAFTAVPGHALDAVFMGYFLSKAKFQPQHKQKDLIMALLVTVLMYGIWDFLAFYSNEMGDQFKMAAVSIVVFILFVICLYIFGIRKINELVEKSQFKDNPPATWINISNSLIFCIALL